MKWPCHPPYRSRSRRAIRFLRRRGRTTAPILSAPRHRNPRHPSRGNARDLDPAILRLIATKEGLSSTEVEALLNTQCGLLGISGVTNDMKVLLQELREHDDRRIRLAIEIFCYRARKYIGALLASMGGADAVIFTGGIGEHAPEIRARICAGLEWAGLVIDADRNAQTMGREGQISVADSRLQAWVIPTDEELLIARDTVRCILGEPHPT